MRLSILMPVYNEAETVAAVVKRVLDVPYPCEVELVVVDDGSTDGTAAILAGLAADARVSVHTHPRNRGKGAAVRTAAERATGSHIVMCDADAGVLAGGPAGAAARRCSPARPRWSSAPGASAATPRTRSGSSSATRA